MAKSKIKIKTNKGFEKGDIITRTFQITDYKPPKTTPMFPIVIRICDSQEILMIKTADELPRGKAFVIIQTNQGH